MTLARSTDVVVSNAVLDDTRLLMVRESKPAALGRWSLPAGRVEAGEALVEAAVREAREETGLEVEPVSLLGIFHAPITLEGGSALHVAFRSEVRGGVLAANDDQPEVGFLDRQVVDDLIERRLVRGTHVGLVLAALDGGRTLPISTIVEVPPSLPPVGRVARD